MKQCSHCFQWKDETEFNWRITGVKLWGICRECQRKQKQDWYQEHREEHIKAKYEYVKIRRASAKQYVYDYLSTYPCVHCGERDVRVLEFDHLGEKDNSIAEMVAEGVSVAMLERESQVPSPLRQLSPQKDERRAWLLSV